MKTDIGLRIELDIPAQRILSNVRFYNQDVEKQVEAGVNLAIQELADNTDIARMVADAIKQKLEQNIVSYVLSYEVNNAIQDAIRGAIFNKIKSYSEVLETKIETALS